MNNEIYATLFVGLITTLAALTGIYFSERARIISVVDDLYSLMREIEQLRHHKTKEGGGDNDNDLANLQLQAKHMPPLGRRPGPPKNRCQWITKRNGACG